MDFNSAALNIGDASRTIAMNIEPTALKAGVVAGLKQSLQVSNGLDVGFERRFDM